MKKRDISVELIRIIAILMVIGNHTAGWYLSGDTVLRGNLMIYGFFQDAVPLFWYATGMFLFKQGNTFKKNVTRTVFRVVLPSAALVFFAAIFAPWFEGKASLKTCFTASSLNWPELLNSIFNWKTTGLPLSGHLWFVFSYVKVILWYPLLAYACKEDDSSRKVRHYLIALAVIAEAIGDLQQFGSLSFGKIAPFTILDPSLLFVVIGYEISIKLDKIRGHKAFYRVLGISIYIICSCARYLITKSFYDAGIKNQAFEHIENLLTIISSVGLMSALLTIEPAHVRLQRIIYTLAKYTFGIFLIHRLRSDPWPFVLIVTDCYIDTIQATYSSPIFVGFGVSL